MRAISPRRYSEGGALTLTIGSLFSGIGGLELGLEWAGLGPVLWQVERDPYCQRVLAKHWPNAERFDDVRTVGASVLRPVDVICGGFPCQDISFAGAGAGIAGARSGLWFEYARIVRELRPRFVVVENVAALLSRGMGEVLGSLASLGYDARWDCISAASVGAPHLRERIFIVAHARIVRSEDDEFAGENWKTPWRAQPGPSCTPQVADAERDGCASGLVDARSGALGNAPSTEGERGPALWPTPTTEGNRNRAGALAEIGRRTSNRSRAMDGDGWAIEPDVGRVADGIPARVDRLRALGNAVVPQCAEVVGRVVRAIHDEGRGL